MDSILADIDVDEPENSDVEMDDEEKPKKAKKEKKEKKDKKDKKSKEEKKRKRDSEVGVSKKKSKA